jgi:acyl-coenzyme A synthetase/AMP-(fatty) acid ligase/thioesterase domain-containing protein/acyl carrier protein
VGDTVITYANLFEEMVDAQPDALAVIADDDRVLTYAELDRLATQLANAILDADPDGAFPMVAMALEQNTDAIISMVAVAKTERTGVLLDPGDPPARLAEVLGRLEPALIVLQEHHERSFALVPEARRRLVRADEIADDADAVRRPQTADAEADSLVFFTSGTTGTPKAASRTHRAIAEIYSRETQPWCAPGVRHASVADYQWIAGWANVRRTLCSGGTVVHYSTRRRGPGELARFLAEHEVQHLGAVPSLVRAMLDADPLTALPALTSVTFSGDILHRDLVMAVFDRLGPDATIMTSYGASELGGVAKLEMRRDTVPEGDILPVGFVHARAEVEIEDPDADGVGRLIVVSRRGAPAHAGAHDRDESVAPTEDGRWRHRTSDLGRFRPDGMLEIVGRLPHMAKVRGQRIGVSEVEAALLSVPGVRDAAVGVHPDDPAHRLAAWFVPADGADLHVADLRRLLRPRLPAFMIPAAFVAMPTLPRGTRGKLRREQLPAPTSGRPDLGYPYDPPRGPVEEAIAQAFGRVLDIEQVGRDDELFDLGGDSLQAAEVMTAIAAALGRDLPLSVFVEAATPAQLAERLEESADGSEPSRMVVLQAEGDGPPIDCIHGGGGQVLSLAPLADRLGSTRPFIGIQMAQQDRARRLFRVARLADRYARAIAERQGTEPCIVAGHSYGGVVAQEVSRLLASRGVPVEACVLLDTSLPRRRMISGRRRRLRALGDVELAVEPPSAVKELLYVAHAVSGLAPAPHRLTTERMIASLWGMSWHRVRSTPVPLVVLRAATQPARSDLSAWASHTQGGCTVVDTPGGHNSMLTAPYVDDLASLINLQLDAASSRPLAAARHGG